MTSEQVLPFSVVSVVEDVLQQHGVRSCDVNLASRKAEEACIYPLSSLFSQFHWFWLSIIFFYCYVNQYKFLWNSLIMLALTYKKHFFCFVLKIVFFWVFLEWWKDISLVTAWTIENLNDFFSNFQGRIIAVSDSILSRIVLQLWEGMKRLVGWERWLELLEGKICQLSHLKKTSGLGCVVGLSSATFSTKFNLGQCPRYVWHDMSLSHFTNKIIALLDFYSLWQLLDLYISFRWLKVPTILLLFLMGQHCLRFNTLKM